MFSYFFLEEKFCVSAYVGKSLARMFIVWSVPKTLSRKLYPWLYLTQTVHSNDKILFPRRKNYLLKFLRCATHILLFLIFLKEKLCVSAHVSKSRACLDRVYFVSKKLSFSCVCSMKMGLLKRVSLVLLDKKRVKFWFNGKILSLLIIFSQLIFCQVPNCKMLVSTNILLISQSSLKAYAHILYTRIQNKENSLSLCGKLSSHWKQQWPAKKRKNNRLAHTH